MTVNDYIIFILRKVDFAVRILLIIILVILIIIASYFLYDNTHIRQSYSSKIYAEYRPDVNKDNMSYRELQQINPENISWITIDDTSIDYPVVQGSNNEKYLNTNAAGKHDTCGSLFLDCNNDKNFSDVLNIIYGHNMFNGGMLGELDKFKDYSFFKEHKYGSIFIDNQYKGLNIFAFINDVDGYDSSIYSPIDSDSVDEIISRLKHNALYYREAEIDDTSRVVILSTCSHGKTNGRNVLACTITEEKKDNNTTAASKNVKHSGKLTIPVWIYCLTVICAFLLVLIFIIRKTKRRK